MSAPKAERILIIRYRFIGDTILTVPFLRNVRYAYPQAQIDILVGPQSGEVLRGCPYVNELITFDTTRFHKYDRGEGKAKSFFSYAVDIRKRKYDLVLVLKRSLSSALLAFLSGAKHRIGYATEGRSFLLSKGVAMNRDIHEVESTLDVLKAAEIPIVDRHLEAFVSVAETNEIQEIAPALLTAKRKVLIHAAAAHPDKIYPLDKWAAVVKALHEREGFTPFFSGASQDVSLYKELEDKSGVKAIHLAGKLSLRQSIALYKEMDLAVCVDSGPAHLSAATGTPTLSIFGPTDPVRWRPYGDLHAALFDETLSCRPCNYKKTCTDRECLTELDPNLVVSNALALLSAEEARVTESTERLQQTPLKNP